jgi:hypothetical protein
VQGGVGLTQLLPEQTRPSQQPASALLEQSPPKATQHSGGGVPVVPVVVPLVVVPAVVVVPVVVPAVVVVVDPVVPEVVVAPVDPAVVVPPLVPPSGVGLLEQPTANRPKADAKAASMNGVRRAIGELKA